LSGWSSRLNARDGRRRRARLRTSALENHDLLAHILVALGRASVPVLVLAGGACKQWRHAVQGEGLWRELCCDHFSSITNLAGVTSWRHLCMQLRRVPDPELYHPPASAGQHNLDQYQFLVRFREGQHVMLDVCLRGGDAVDRRPEWTTSPAHRHMGWPVHVELGVELGALRITNSLRSCLTMLPAARVRSSASS
jgi:hypothetical protein